MAPLLAVNFQVAGLANKSGVEHPVWMRALSSWLSSAEHSVTSMTEPMRVEP